MGARLDDTGPSDTVEMLDRPDLQGTKKAQSRTTEVSYQELVKKESSELDRLQNL